MKFNKLEFCVGGSISNLIIYKIERDNINEKNFNQVVAFEVKEMEKFNKVHSKCVLCL
jgi:predicted transcriptional regulator YdeE